MKRSFALGLVVFLLVVVVVFAAAKTTTPLPSPTPALLPTNTATIVVAAATPLASNTLITVEIIENCWHQPLKLSTEIFDWNKTVYAYLSRGRVP